MSSPGNSKANGAAEAAVKIAKRLLRKCRTAHEDPYLGLLNLRNTPREGLKTSPAQRLMGRRTKTLVPTTSYILKPSSGYSKDESERMEDKQVIVGERCSNRRVLRPLQPGKLVRIQPIQAGRRDWEQATVTKRLVRRSYEATTDDGHKYRRNRQFLRESPRPREINVQRSPQPRTVPDETVSITPTKSPDKAQSPVKESTDITRLPSSPNVTQPYVTNITRLPSSPNVTQQYVTNT